MFVVAVLGNILLKYKLLLWGKKIEGEIEILPAQCRSRGQLVPHQLQNYCSEAAKQEYWNGDRVKR